MRGKDSRGEHCFVLNTGAKIPAIGLGTWQSGGDICIEAVTTALKFGYRHIDCSHLYGNEVEVGKALAEAFDGGLKREDLFLTSKLYFTSNSHKRVENSVRVSLENLSVSYLDLYLVHWPESSAMEDATDPPWNSGNEYKQFLHRLKPTWKAVESLVEMGLVRAIGISNFTIQQIKELLQFAKIVPAVNQVELHPFWRQDELVKFCQQSGIHVSAHTPLGVPASNSSLNIGSGFSDSGSEDEPGTPRITFRRSRSVHGPMLKLSVVADIAEQHMKTPEQPISNFTRSNEANSELAKMNGTSSPHWDASLRTGTPTPRERNEMRSLSLFEEELHLPASVRMQSCFIHPLCWNAKLLRPHEAFSLHGNVGSKDERQETKRITEFGGTPVDAA